VTAAFDAEVNADPLDHSGLAAKRVLAGALAGIAAASVAVVNGASWPVAALCGSDVAAIVYMLWVGITVAGSDAAATARLAQAEDGSRAAADAVLVSAGLASLIAVGFVLAQAGRAHAPARGLLTVLTVVSVGLAWASLHTVYVLRYARMYYVPPEGGIDFSDERPDYRDFAYLAVTIGTTYQVSDTTLKSQPFRRSALRHALLSYVFGTAIVAVMVNIVATLLGR
jgi:uncharacterized membrane protein